MRKLFIIAALGFGLAGCASLQQDYAIITGATVSPAAVIVAGNSFDAIEATATNYLVFCKANRTISGCGSYVAARKAILPAVRSGRVARNNLENFLTANPGALGPSGLYNALVTAINTLQGVASTYNIAGVSK
jgi:hypothetical protein